MKCYKRCGYLIHENKDVATLGRLQSILGSLSRGIDPKHFGEKNVLECLEMVGRLTCGHYYEEVKELEEIDVEVEVA